MNDHRGWAFAACLLLATASAADEDAFSFPPEWAPHEAVWMGWTDTVARQDGIQELWAQILQALTPHVTVKLVAASPAAEAQARQALTPLGVDFSNIRFVIQPTTDIWLRDSGPLFITDGETRQIADFRWAFYGFPSPYGDPVGFARGNLDREAAIGMGLQRRQSPVVAEGGGLDVNSNTLVAYKDAALHRNPGVSLEQLEAEYLRLYGKQQLIWLSRAPVSDRIFVGPKVGNFFGWGANGHVDEYVRFVDEQTIFVAQVADEERERNALYRLDHEILAENRAELQRARSPDGEPYRVVPVPMPDVTTMMRTRRLTAEDFVSAEEGWDGRAVYRDFAVGDEIHFLPATSYLNFLVTNGVVLVARYWREGLPTQLRETDEQMRALLATQYPSREIVQINPLALNWWGGGIHCVTQQEPALRSAR